MWVLCLTSLRDRASLTLSGTHSGHVQNFSILSLWIADPSDCGVRLESGVILLLQLWFRMPPGGWGGVGGYLCVVIVVCCQVEVSVLG